MLRKCLKETGGVHERVVVGVKFDTEEEKYWRRRRRRVYVPMK
jgi:hypothetical protein